MTRHGHNKFHSGPHRSFNKKMKENTSFNSTMVSIYYSKAHRTLFQGLLQLSSTSLILFSESRSGSLTTPFYVSASPTPLSSSDSDSKHMRNNKNKNEAITISMAIITNKTKAKYYIGD